MDGSFIICDPSFPAAAAGAPPSQPSCLLMPFASAAIARAATAAIKARHDATLGAAPWKCYTAEQPCCQGHKARSGWLEAQPGSCWPSRGGRSSHRRLWLPGSKKAMHRQHHLSKQGPAPALQQSPHPHLSSLDTLKSKCLLWCFCGRRHLDVVAI